MGAISFIKYFCKINDALTTDPATLYRTDCARAYEHVGNILKTLTSWQYMTSFCNVIPFNVWWLFDNVGSDSNKFKLLIKESLLIKHKKPALNRMIKPFPFDLFN